MNGCVALKSWLKRRAPGSAPKPGVDMTEPEWRDVLDLVSALTEADIRRIVREEIEKGTTK